MSRNKKVESEPSDTISEIRLGLDDLFETLGSAISEISNRMDIKDTGEIHRSLEIDTGKGPIRAEAGVRVRFAGAKTDDPIGRRAPVRTTSATKPMTSPRSPAVEPRTAERSIEFDIIEDAESWRLMADIPGIDRDDIVLSSDNGDLSIETRGLRLYRGRTRLPADITLDDLKVTLRNGILELCAHRNGMAPK